MAFVPHWRAGETGWFPIPCDGRERCLYCKGDLKKLHGLNRDGNGGLYKDQRNRPYVMAFFAFGAGPYCWWCATKEAWENPNFFQQSGSNEYHSRNFDTEATLRPRFPSIEEELKKL
jgi:hypothetical protein